jgi:hypothetical protein
MRSAQARIPTGRPTALAITEGTSEKPAFFGAIG